MAAPHNGRAVRIISTLLAAMLLLIIPQSFLTKEFLRSHGPVASISVAAVHTNSQATTTTDKTKSSPGWGLLKKKGRVLYRYQRIFHVPGLHPAALTQLQGAGVCLQGQQCRAPRRRACGAAPVHPGALRKAGIHHQRLPHRCPQRCRGRSKSSQHLLGRAADFHVEGVPVAAVAAYG